MSPIVLVDTLITKATAQLQEGVLIEAEVTLRGAIVVADRLGDPMTSLRARNNLFGVVGPDNAEAVLVLVRDMYEIAERYGQRTWVQQALGVAVSTSFDAGRWDDWIPEMLDEEPQASEFYRQWYRSETAHRLAYRGRHADAEAMFDDILATEVVRGSRQGTAGVSQLVAELRILQGRFVDAFESARGIWATAEGAEGALAISMFAAAAIPDAVRMGEANAMAAVRLTGDQAMTAATRQVGRTLEAALAERWDETRQGFIAVSRSSRTAATSSSWRSCGWSSGTLPGIGSRRLPKVSVWPRPISASVAPTPWCRTIGRGRPRVRWRRGRAIARRRRRCACPIAAPDRIGIPPDEGLPDGPTVPVRGRPSLRHTRPGSIDKTFNTG